MLKFALVLMVEIVMPDGTVDTVTLESEYSTAQQCNFEAQAIAESPGVISAECYRLVFT